VRELQAQERLSAHESKNAATMIVEPVDRAPRHVFGHALDLVVKGPAIPAIEIAFVLDEQIRRDGMEIAGQNPRAHVRE